jgi:DNA-binding transcriptional ArsR family regulator
MTEEHEPSPARDVDLESLKALAHPLRVRIVDTLATYGAFTASGLAERLGESSGATSYHLRQLEKHNFVREVEGRGTARERWWERVPVSINVRDSRSSDSPASKAATQLVLSEWTRNREQKLRDFVERGDDVLGDEWVEAATVSTASLFLTVEQLAEIGTALEAYLDEQVAKYVDQRIVGARPVHLQFAAFPVVDGAAITSEDAP